jgi:hypothetical protein
MPSAPSEMVAPVRMDELLTEVTGPVKVTRRKSEVRFRDPAPPPQRVNDVIRDYKRKHISRHRARTLVGFSRWTVGGWLRDLLRLSAQFRPDYPDDHTMAVWTSANRSDARASRLITRHEHNMLDPVSRVGEGWGWWLLDRRPKFYVALAFLAVVAVAALVFGPAKVAIGCGILSLVLLFFASSRRRRRRR